MTDPWCLLSEDEDEEQRMKDLSIKHITLQIFKLHMNFNCTSTALYNQPNLTEIYIHTLFTWSDTGKIGFWHAIASVWLVNGTGNLWVKLALPVPVARVRVFPRVWLTLPRVYPYPYPPRVPAGLLLKVYIYIDFKFKFKLILLLLPRWDLRETRGDSGLVKIKNHN